MVGIPEQTITLAETDFQDKGEYRSYMKWVNSGRKSVPLPSTERLENFIGVENDKARQYGFEKVLNDLDPEARVAITAIKNKELVDIKRLPKQGEALAAEGVTLDNTIKSIVNNKNATALERAHELMAGGLMGNQFYFNLIFSLICLCY